MPGKSRYIISFLIFTLFIMMALTACSSDPASTGTDDSSQNLKNLPEEPLEITITVGTDQRPVAYELLSNKWNKAVYDRSSYKEVLFKKLDEGRANTCQTGESVTFDFGQYPPAKLTLKADRYTDRLSSYMPPIMEIPVEGLSFKLLSTYAGHQDNTFFVLTATWDDENEVEYAFVMHYSDPENMAERQLLRFIFTDNGLVREYYPIKEQDGKKALLTAEGQELLPYEFDDFMTHYGFVSAKKEGKWQLYEYQGQRLSQDEWDDIRKTTTPMENEVNGLVAVMKDGVWGCVNQQGKVVVTPNWDGIDLNYYEEVEPYLRVMKDGKYGYLTYDGKSVLKAEYDMAVMDVLNGSQNIIYVRKGDEWGAVKVVNDKAGKVDWTQKPSVGFQIGFMNQRYGGQAQTVHDLLYSDRWGTNASVIHFFYSYYEKNQSELFNLPDFTGKDVDWDQLTKFVYANSWDVKFSGKGEARSFLTEEEFDRITSKYLTGIQYSHQPSKWLSYEDGRYTPVGWSDHGFRCYYLNRLERTETSNGQYIFKAGLLGYQFWEEDFAEGADVLSPNMQALKKKAQEGQYTGKTLKQVLDELMIGDPTQIFTPTVEHAIEFTIEEPLGDIYLKYSAASKKELTQ